MGMIIAVNGKGGTGKTTVSSLLLRNLISSKKGSILAVDADPNSNLHDLLGVASPNTIVDIVEDVSKNLENIPAGMTKDRFIEMKIQDSFVEENDYDLLVMGRPEGPGCYCYVNNLLRDMMAKIIKNYDFVVIDNAAGMEHISRRTTRAIDRLVLVSDASVIGLRSTKRIYELARNLGIKVGKVFLIVNKVTETGDALNEEIKKTVLEFVGIVPHSEELKSMSIAARPIFELKDAKVTDSIDRIAGDICR